MDREWKEKYDLIDDEEEDTLTFHFRNRFIFRPDRSGNLTGDEIVVVPHPCNHYSFYSLINPKGILFGINRLVYQFVFQICTCIHSKISSYSCYNLCIIIMHLYNAIISIKPIYFRETSCVHYKFIVYELCVQLAIRNLNWLC